MITEDIKKRFYGIVSANDEGSKMLKRIEERIIECEDDDYDDVRKNVGVIRDEYTLFRYGKEEEYFDDIFGEDIRKLFIDYIHLNKEEGVVFDNGSYYVIRGMDDFLDKHITELMRYYFNRKHKEYYYTKPRFSEGRYEWFNHIVIDVKGEEYIVQDTEYDVFSVRPMSLVKEYGGLGKINYLYKYSLDEDNIIRRVI